MSLLLEKTPGVLATRFYKEGVFLWWFAFSANSRHIFLSNTINDDDEA
jgi:hypothetical protein